MKSYNLKNNEIKIEFYGHSFFRVESNDIYVTFDPVGEETGYVFEDKVDSNLLLVSHEHYDHANRNLINLMPKEDLNVFTKVTKIESYHDDEEGQKRGFNTIHLVEINGFKICHLGDLGHVLDENQISQIGDVDILFLPIGGTYTIDSSKSVEVAMQLNSKIIIPMHYKTDKLKFELETVDSFISNVNNKVNNELSITKIESNEIIFTKEELELKKSKEIYVLDIKR